MGTSRAKDVRRISSSCNLSSQSTSKKERRMKKSCKNFTTGSKLAKLLVSNKPKFAKKKKNNAWQKRGKNVKRRKKKKKRRGRRKRQGRRPQSQTCLFTTVDTWLELKRISQTRDKLIVKSRRNGSLKTRRPSTLTILELTDFAKKQKNCGKSFTVTKNRNTTLNRELLARNMIATNCVNVSTSTWASSTRTRAKSRLREADVSVPLKSSNKFVTCSSIIISKNLIRFH